MISHNNYVDIIKNICVKYIIDLKNLPAINYNKELINYKSIFRFSISNKYNNDSYNKTRENIIGAIINKKIPNCYYIKSNLWNKLYTEIFNYISLLSNNIKYNYIIVKHMGGRKYNYDMIFIFYLNNIIISEFNIEFKFNCKSISNSPQFISPTKPSVFLSNSYEQYFYDNYLSIISAKYKLTMPSNDIYIKTINSTKPDIMKSYKELYDKGCSKHTKFSGNTNDIEFYNYINKLSKLSIIEFIKITDLDYTKLSKYLYDTQKNKIYMLYYNNSFILDKPNINNFNIINVIKNKNRYDCISENGAIIKVLLRWKNGNGIAFPAFQIS